MWTEFDTQGGDMRRVLTSTVMKHGTSQMAENFRPAENQSLCQE